MSNLLQNIIFVQNGIDEIRRNITMHISENNNGASIVDLDVFVRSDLKLSSGAHVKGYKVEQPTIETILLGDLLGATLVLEKPTRIVIKMDIEGFECRAILGENLCKVKLLFDSVQLA